MKSIRRTVEVEVEVEVSVEDVLDQLDAETMVDLIELYAGPRSVDEVLSYIESHLWTPDDWARLQRAMETACRVCQRRAVA